MQYRKRMLRKKGTALLLSALLLASALPLAAEEVSAKTTEYVNFRSGPGTNYSSQGDHRFRHDHHGNGYEQFRVVRRASF